MILSVINQKGGVGKTTLAVHIAFAFTEKDKRVLLVDADPQGSALDWSASRADTTSLPVIGLPKAILHKELPKMETFKKRKDRRAGAGLDIVKRRGRECQASREMSSM